MAGDILSYVHVLPCADNEYYYRTLPPDKSLTLKTSCDTDEEVYDGDDDEQHQYPAGYLVGFRIVVPERSRRTNYHGFLTSV